MNVLLDVRMRRHAGIGSYVRGLHAALAGRQDVEVIAEGAEPDAPPIYSLREQVWYRGLARRHAGRLLHAPHHNAPLRWPGPLVVTVHDLAHVLCPEAPRRRGARVYSTWMLRHVARRADAIVCVSLRTRDDLVALAPQAAGRCHVVHQGVDETLVPPGACDVERVLGEHGLRPGYVLYLGTLRPHKNPDALIRAWRALGDERPPLVLAGRDEMPAGWPERSAPDVTRLGWVPDEDRAPLYAGASVLCFPSLFEGFGLPPLEAMRCGTPVVCSVAAALPEVVGDAALLVPPRDQAALAAALRRVLDDAALRDDLVRRGHERAARYTWERAADRTVAAYADAAERRSVTAAADRAPPARQA